MPTDNGPNVNRFKSETTDREDGAKVRDAPFCTCLSLLDRSNLAPCIRHAKAEGDFVAHLDLHPLTFISLERHGHDRPVDRFDRAVINCDRSGLIVDSCHGALRIGCLSHGIEVFGQALRELAHE